MTADDLLRDERTLILEETWRSVVKLKHYERDGEEATRQRLEVLYDEVVSAVSTRDLCALLDYAEQIAQQRFDAGFDLSEVQTAFFMLEETIWRRALVRIPAANLADALGLVTTVMRRGRDAVGRAYLSLATQGRAPSLDLSRLFKDS
jgi:hypothetical protein